MKIYCDMDGVLVDFMGAVRTTFNLPDLKDGFGPNIEKKIADTPGFWENLNWLPDGKELWEFCDSHGCHILSAYADWDATSAAGKLKWIARELGDIDPARIHLVKREEKKLFAAENHVLVDDYIRTIKEWEKAGGIGIHHKTADESIKKLTWTKELLIG